MQHAPRMAHPVMVDLVDSDDGGVAALGAGHARSHANEFAHHSRRRQRSTVIDLTGDGNDVASPPRPRTRHRAGQAAAIDLTLDSDNDGDLLFVSARAPPPPPPPSAHHAPPRAPAPAQPQPRGFDAASVPAGNLRLFALFDGHRRSAAAMQQLPGHVQNMRGARVMLHLPPSARPKRTRRVRLARVERQPVGDSQCPICFEDMRDTDKKSRALRVEWCQYGCGANVHAACMDDWRKSRPYKNTPVGCVLCRTDWKGWKDEPVE